MLEFIIFYHTIYFLAKSFTIIIGIVICVCMFRCCALHISRITTNKIVLYHNTNCIILEIGIVFVYLLVRYIWSFVEFNQYKCIYKQGILLK